MARFVVKRHRPWQWALSVIILSMIIATITWLMLDKSHWAVIQGKFRDNHDKKILLETNDALERENIALRERVLMLERTTSLDKQTAALLQDELKSMQEDVYELKGELEFYQGIMEATAGVKGLDVHGIHVRTLAQPRKYRLKVILTNVATSGRLIEGRVEITIEGRQDGATILASLADISMDQALDMAFKFRNFKRMENNIELPEGFLPQRVFVQLIPKGKKQSTIKKVFDWPVVAG